MSIKLIGQVILDREGEIVAYRSKVRDFFGAYVDDILCFFEPDDLVRMNREFPGRAPHKIEDIFIKGAAT